MLWWVALSATHHKSDIIYSMNEWYKEKQKILQQFFINYGKLTLVFSVVVACLFCLAGLSHLATAQSLKVSFLDIGQGDAILIQTPDGHDMLIDGGGTDKVLEKISHELGFFDQHLDVVVNTHPDADHSTGLIAVLKKYDIGAIVVSPIDGHTGVFEVLKKSIIDEGSDIHVGKKGDTITFSNGVVAHILYPASPYHGDKNDTNDASVSMVITYGDESVLLTGDLPTTHEEELLQSVLPHHITIYKAGHHGSKYSSGDQLLSYIRPEYSVISAGKNNRYSHPSPDAIERLQTYSQEILSTIDKGTITFLLDGRNVKVRTTK